ncbi:hypothetical protein C8A01DRAFT_46954 [Parachaetomium inaequale]|uniref:PA14 domain-containing protein n=1 Tax=Parachaetomium inaequale TaxID=2588326 RepID=A0AAN6SRR5_9PEZI|nr:hypothetical protein C8A01DRAFT_46954 [Parachaetomium inaequale]
MLKTLAPLGAVFVSAATALALGERHDTPSTTTTIPYLGDCTTSTTLTGCSGQVTVVVQTPIAVPACTTTATSTAPPTSTPTPGGACLLIDPFCKPAGLDIEYYANPMGGYSSGNPPSSYYLTQGLRPLDSSLTNVTFFPQNTNPVGLERIYPYPPLPNAPYFVGWQRETNGGVVVDANNFTLVYQGFYRARKTGTHAICASADNEDDVFFGHGNAFSCLDGKASANAQPLLVATGASLINGVICKDVDLVSGLYYPVRNVMGNWQGGSAFNFTVKEPDVALEDRTHDFAGRVYPSKCGLLF